MTWLVFAVSAVLVAAGAVAVASGAPIIQIERGWAEVIAGSVALSSGFVVFALGVLALRLHAIHQALGDRAPAAPALGAPDPFALRKAFDEPAPSEPVVPEEPPMPEPADDVSGARHGLWKRIRRTNDEPAEAAERSTAGLAGPADLVPVIDVEPPEPRPFPRSTEIDFPAITAAPDPEPAHSVASEAIGPAPETPVAAEPDRSIDWLDRGLFSARAPRPVLDLDEPPRRFELPHRAEVREERSAAALPHLPEPEPEPEPSPPQEPESTGEEEGAAQATIIGRYQAGVASYVMYSDGTIEVETDDGPLRRFSSMDELKTFIASQETAVT